jgi:hypothetical protein
MRPGNANCRLGVSAIFHSKCLKNDGRRSASSRLVTGDAWLWERRFCPARFMRLKMFVAQRSSYI